VIAAVRLACLCCFAALPGAAMAGGASLWNVMAGGDADPMLRLSPAVGLGTPAAPAARRGRSTTPAPALRPSRPLLTSVVQRQALARSLHREQDAISPDGFSLSASVDLAASAQETGLGLDLGLTPRLEVVSSSIGSSLSAGAEVRVGRFSQGADAGNGPTGWYLYAGADGQQLTVDVDRAALLSMPAVRYGEHVSVGDFQAGLSIDRFRGQFGLSYIRRDVSFEEADRVEHFAGLTFAVRR
jgi:hypothetical protein